MQASTNMGVLISYSFLFVSIKFGCLFRLDTLLHYCSFVHSYLTNIVNTGKDKGTCYSTAYMSETRAQKRRTVYKSGS